MIILEKPLIKKTISTFNEYDELISIFFTSINTATQNMKKR
jgi:hypothetical protein